MKHCNTLQHKATRYNTMHTNAHCNKLHCTATQCFAVQHTAAHCNTLQRGTAISKYTLQLTARRCNTLQHTAALQHTANTLQRGKTLSIVSKYAISLLLSVSVFCSLLQSVALTLSAPAQSKFNRQQLTFYCIQVRHLYTLQHTATQCHALQITATHCNTLQTCTSHLF